MGRRTRIIIVAVAVLATLASLFSCYSVMFWGWVAATPLTPQQLDRVRYNHDAWLAIGVVSAVVVIAAVLALVWHRITKMVR
jgi:hypothetical protein